MQKRVLAVNDISCVGRCSLTVALPVLSAAGIETSVLPTAILSTHTGGFDGYTFRDLTNDITPIVQHIKSLGRVYDGIFTGYLGSFSQLSEVTGLIRELKTENCLVTVDPVMADNGEYYSFFRMNLPAGWLFYAGRPILSRRILPRRFFFSEKNTDPVRIPEIGFGICFYNWRLSALKRLF